MKWVTLLFAATLFATDPCETIYGHLFPSSPCLRDRSEISLRVCEEESRSGLEDFSAADIHVDLCKEKSSRDEWNFPSETLNVISERSLNCPCDPQQMFWTSDVSALAWQAREEGLEFALKTDSLVNPDFKWEPAFKVNVGVDFPIRAWDVNLRWTRFHTDSHFSDTGNLVPVWILPSTNIGGGTFLYNSAKGAWTLLLNEFDIEMGYHVFLSPAMALRFHCDIKVTTIDQTYHMAYTNGIAPLLSATTQFSNRSIGAGPRLGFDSKWFLGRGFSLQASIAGSLPLWHYRIYRDDSDLATTGATIDSHFGQRFWTFRSILETAVGIGWDTCLGCRCQFPFGFAASYELQYFPEQNMMAKLVNPGVLHLAFEPRGDLHLHGATFTLHFGF